MENRYVNHKRMLVTNSIFLILILFQFKNSQMT